MATLREELYPYCNFCGKNTQRVLKTRAGLFICFECAVAEGLCETCGSLPLYLGQPTDEIPHYEEDCFK